MSVPARGSERDAVNASKGSRGTLPNRGRAEKVGQEIVFIVGKGRSQ